VGQASRSTASSARTGVFGRIRSALPRGGVLSAEDFAKRQRVVVAVLLGHLIGVLAFGLSRGTTLPDLILAEGVVLLFTIAAWQPHLLRPRPRAAVSAVGLLMCSAILVQMSDGSIEMHFHFFVMVALIALYQDWLPFLLAIAFVAMHHGVIGVLAPDHVYDHHEAWSAPWKWAAIHAAFVLAASAAQVAQWRMVEDEYDRSNVSLRARERRFRSLIEHSLDAVAIVDSTGRISYESESVEHVLGFPAGHREGRDAVSFAHPDDLELTESLMSAAMSAPGCSSSGELRAQHIDDSWRWLDVRISNLIDDPDVGGLVVNYRDITERRTLEEELARQAFHDSLSGLANRALFLDRLDHALATQGRRGAGLLAVLFIDLDDFKTVNDGLGHSTGDDVLREIGSRLHRAARAADTCARLGGDEFAILLEGLEHADEAQMVGRHLLDVLRQPVTIDGDSVTLTASIGVVVSEGVESAAQLMRNADLAMYKAKRAGKGRHEVFEPGMQEAAVERLALREDLRRAVDAGEIVVHYQPIVDLPTTAICGAEALARWMHPHRGMLGPDVFIELAEETGLIIPIGKAILEQACVDAAAWPDDHPLKLSVNLSTRQLHEPTIVDDVIGALDRSGLDPHRLTLEITESILIGNPDAALATLSALKDVGVSIALDDFGTGFSSLSYLARFPVDVLKIDKSFVDALAEDGRQQDSALVDAIIDMSNTLELQVTAEGIESQDQADRLVLMGCSNGQGFHFARPMPQSDLLDTLRTPTVATV
jgi:diguanylate cyclase (GGDEF)-like protein/PAS domain S-box-containing protein